MARRSARLSSQQASSPAAAQSTPPSSSPASTGRKRKAKNESGASPSAKRGKKDEKQQQTIEDSMDIEKNEPEQPVDDEKIESKPQGAEQAPDPTAPSQEATKQEPKPTNGEDDAKQQEETNGNVEERVEPNDDSSKQQATTNGEQKNQTASDNKSEAEQEPASNTNGDAVEAHARDEKVPSSILEKGIFYFLFRGRVNIENPDSVQDVARSYLVLRPLPHGAKLSDGAMGDDKNCRLIAIPKKMLPVSGKDRWTAFVEKSSLSIKELKDGFLEGDDYETQAGSRHSPAATPAAEGVYAITTTGRESHLAYITTLPENPGDLQNDLGLKAQGSFVLSTKNPKTPGPASADIGKDPGYPQEIQDKFRALRWAPTEPKMLDYEGCQFLMIGEGEKGLEKATEAQEGDEKKTDPKDELEKLEDEDELRVEHLNGEDAVFTDLGTNAKDYPKLQTTW